ncbi:helix-turn-helix domain-containing protein [Actinocorallia longicatena]
METGRQLRADARRNRERILAAARAVFLEEGADVQMEPIARRAGVGIGTVYRNFPTKQVLIDEVGRQWVEERCTATASALQIEDPAEALRVFVTGASAAMARDVGIRKVLSHYEEVDTAEADALHLLQLKTLLDRVRAAGLVRPDLTPPDLFGLMCGMAFAIFRGTEPALCAEVLLRGLRPT